jgi:SAM-dependent methyltransferase
MTMSNSEVLTLIDSLLEQNDLLYAVFSSPKSKAASVTKAILRPVKVKNETRFQLTTTKGAQEFHKTLESKEVPEVFENLFLKDFKQGTICSSKADYHLLSNKKDELTILKRAPTRALPVLDHNRKKKHLLPEGERIPFLIELGVMTADGKVIGKMSDKFRQINRFVEMIDDIIPHLNTKKKLEIVDFGCGKGYLTFALYHYLSVIKKYSVHLVGLDLKKEVVEECQRLADRLGYRDLTFIHGDIKNYVSKISIDMMIALHACDTATDAAIEKAVNWNAKVILAVPCCQHELYSQVKNAALEPLLKHGILKERFAALVTDAARANLLEAVGYHTQILEFIDMEHTPKNLLIRAVKASGKTDVDKHLKAYEKFKETLQIDPCLERLFNSILESRG